ncbi:MAG: hypothetical protein HYW89_00515 [Candidatus Sungiibacteriota bacterium]|uniref:Uncharacterized protein n=1 Tax=Candidatus Sungiibacteriota bacterium TaxID=2750080 RepID=A0A7T5UQQ0_9BACT|nr:MAG: hypothetical protein HYW89_00515 [Candidatus Sungbacteria bacterium]
MTRQQKEQERGIRVAEKYGLKKTAEIIRRGGCFGQIFNTAVDECGQAQTVAIITKSRIPLWAYKLANWLWLDRYDRLTPTLTDKLAKVAIQRRNSHYAALFAHLPDITKELRAELEEVVTSSKDTYAAVLLAELPGIRRELREQLGKIVLTHGTNADAFWFLDDKKTRRGISAALRKKLRALEKSWL